MYKNLLNEALLSSKPSKEIYKLIESGKMKKIIPEFLKLEGFNQQTPYHDKDVLEHTLAVVDAIKPELNLRMAALLHDIGKPECFTVDENGRGHFYGHHIESSEQSVIILNRLGYDKDFIDEVRILIRYHYLKKVGINDKGIEKFIKDVGTNLLDDMFELYIADIKGKANPNNFKSVENFRTKVSEYLNKNKDID